VAGGRPAGGAGRGARAAGRGGGGASPPRPTPPRHERDLLACGRRLGLRPVASAAAHFATPDDYAAFRVATAVRRRTLIDRLPPVLAVTPAHHLISVAEMRRRFADLPEAVANTDALAELLSSDVLPR